MLTCPVCNCSRARPAFGKDGLVYHRCPVCRFLFARPAINANFQEIADFNSAYLQYLGEDFGDGKDHAVVLQYMRKLGFRDHHALLDVGCGSGKFVRRMRRIGINAKGIEPSPALFDHFLKNDPAFEQGHIERFSAQWVGAFDCITAFDVIEHTQEPARFLEHAARMLKPKGRMFLSAPDNASLMALVFGKSWHYYNQFHLSMFSPATLRRLAPKYGLRWVNGTRLSRWRSVEYLGRYFFDFVLKRPPPRWMAGLGNVHLPINLFDAMNVCLAKAG